MLARTQVCPNVLIGPSLVHVATGELREAGIVTRLDDHSRFCVIARVVERAIDRAVCLARSEASQRFETRRRSSRIVSFSHADRLVGLGAFSRSRSEA